MGSMICEVIQECHHPDPPAFPDATDDKLANMIWASNVETMVQSNYGPGFAESSSEPRTEQAAERVYLLQFSRYPEELRLALLEGNALRQCRDALKDAGYNASLPSGAKIFVQPWQYKDVKAALVGTELRPYHVVVSESLEYLVSESLQQIPRQLKIKIKARSAIHLDEATSGKGGEDSLGNELNTEEFDGVSADTPADIVVRRTFICIVPRLRSSASVNQSTTEAHGSLNPRRLAPM